jgi:hypothetical protein
MPTFVGGGARGFVASSIETPSPRESEERVGVRGGYSRIPCEFKAARISSW